MNRRRDSRTPGPPESIDDAPLSVDEASGLMGDLGFVAFRTPPGTPTADSCLMVMLHDVPTLRHFDPEVVSFWATSAGRGHVEIKDRSARVPFAQEFSWGRIRIVDRIGARNSFVAFGGTLSGERITGATLLIFRSPAPILRLAGHSQREDRLAQEVMTFFGRLVPRLWTSAGMERMVSSAPPLALYGAFLAHTGQRLSHSSILREAEGDEVAVVDRELLAMVRLHPADLAEGRRLLEELVVPPNGR
jgi:hypothetical protein